MKICSTATDFGHLSRSVLVALNWRVFRAANDVAIGIGFVGCHLDVEASLCRVYDSIEESIVDITSAEYRQAKEEGFHAHSCVPPHNGLSAIILLKV